MTTPTPANSGGSTTSAVGAGPSFRALVCPTCGGPQKFTLVRRPEWDTTRNSATADLRLHCGACQWTAKLSRERRDQLPARPIVAGEVSPALAEAPCPSCAAPLGHAETLLAAPCGACGASLVRVEDPGGRQAVDGVMPLLIDEAEARARVGDQTAKAKRRTRKAYRNVELTLSYFPAVVYQTQYQADIAGKTEITTWRENSAGTRASSTHTLKFDETIDGGVGSTALAHPLAWAAAPGEPGTHWVDDDSLARPDPAWEPVREAPIGEPLRAEHLAGIVAYAPTPDVSAHLDAARARARVFVQEQAESHVGGDHHVFDRFDVRWVDERHHFLLVPVYHGVVRDGDRQMRVWVDGTTGMAVVQRRWNNVETVASIVVQIVIVVFALFFFLIVGVALLGMVAEAWSWVS